MTHACDIVSKTTKLGYQLVKKLTFFTVWECHLCFFFKNLKLEALKGLRTASQNTCRVFRFFWRIPGEAAIYWSGKIVPFIINSKNVYLCSRFENVTNSFKISGIFESLWIMIVFCRTLLSLQDDKVFILFSYTVI